MNLLFYTTGTIVLSAVTFSTLERFFPYTKGPKLFREGFWLDFVWYTLIQSYFLGILIFQFIIAPTERALGIAEQGYISHWPMWALVLFFLVTHDFYIYWFHRFQHHNKILWRTHEAHHSVGTCDWLAGSRSHVLEIIINQTIEFAPIVLLLDTETAAVMIPIKGVLDAVWGMFIHANVNVRLGKLGYLINGPEMHQWHHAEHKEVYYANYGTKFAIWDYLFGTAYNPNLKPTVYGLPYAYPKDYFAQHVFSFWRFDVAKLERNAWYNKYDNLRVNFLSWLARPLGLKAPKVYSLAHPQQAKPTTEIEQKALVLAEQD